MSQYAKSVSQWLGFASIITLAGILYHTGTTVKGFDSTIDEHTREIQEIKTSIKSIPAIETDIKWIRQSLERQEQRSK